MQRIINNGGDLMDSTDQFVDCPHPDCQFPNRPGAAYCAQCGRSLPAIAEPYSPPSPVPLSRFLTASGGPITRLDHLGAAMSWCLAIVGIVVLILTAVRTAGKLMGI